MEVVKNSGDVVGFEPKRIYVSVLEAGGSRELAREAKKEVMNQYYQGITTKEILNFILKLLKKEPGVSDRYDLKRAIMSLGPSGFPFENFFAGVLEHYGYKTKVGEKLISNNLVQEVDIIAEKETPKSVHQGGARTSLRPRDISKKMSTRGKKFMVECKYHNKLGIVTKIRYAKKAYDKFLKLKQYNFDQPWLSTNTRCSDDAIRYARNVNLRITSWSYPKSESLRLLIENKKLYPITILKSLPTRIKERLYNSKILIAKDLLQYTPQQLRQKTKLSEEEIVDILKKVREILGRA